jgi:uncharacterized RDD family membrane protein YckC
MPVPEKGKTPDELSTIPLDELTKFPKSAAEQTMKKKLMQDKKQKKLLSKGKKPSVKAKGLSIKGKRPSIKSKSISIKAKKPSIKTKSISAQAKSPSIKSKSISIKSKTLSTGTRSQSLKIDKKQIKIEDIKSVPKSRKKTKTITASKPAGFWIRSIAMIVDLILYVLLFSVLFLAPAYFINPFHIDFSNGLNMNLLREIHRNIRIETYYGLAAGAFFLGLLYFVAATATRGGTIGKKIFGISVFKKKTMTSPIGWWRSILRTISYLVSIVTILIGFIFSAFNKDKRALHDLISGTQISYKK